MKERLATLLIPLLILGVLLAAGLVVLLPAFSEPGAIVTPAEAIVLLALILLAAALVGGAWWRERVQGRRRSEAREDRDRLREEVEERDARLGEREGRLSEREQEVRDLDERLDEERRASSRLERARQAERDYAGRLRNEISQMSSTRGPLGRTDDVPELVLRLAIRLLEAEKGLLLSRRDRDHDGDLDLLAAEGFGEDPEHSQVVQRFAAQVIERDTTVREDAPAEDAGGRPADREIENLVAVPLYVHDDFDGVVVCANRAGGFEDLDDETLVALGDQAGSLLDNARLRGQLRAAYVSTVALLTEALEAKDPFLRGHSEEVSHYVAAVADELDVPAQQREELLFASLLHDVGKIGISERILLKPAALTPEERSVIELHPRIGSRLVEQVPALRPLAATILHHHERWDGQGYPGRLNGPQIPLEARIVAVADSFSAMTAERPYRGRMSAEDACAELEACAGTQFDPSVVAAFVAAVRRQPPGGEGALAAAMDDPDIEGSRGEGEPLLGFGSFAVTDSLTLLYTHGYFRQVLDAEAKRASMQEGALSVVVIELAGLEEENRRSGFPAGDAALSAAARTVQRIAVIRAGTAARYGGARLAVVLRGVDLDEALHLAAESCAAIPDALRPQAGVAQWEPGESGDDLVARARRALEERTAARAAESASAR